MSTDKIFFGYMALTGVVAGGLLVAEPGVSNFWLKPYFWVLIAVLLFEGWLVLRGRPAGTALSMEARLLGFVIGIVLLVVIPALAGSPAKFF
jgi:hypothetical protein